MEKAIIRDTETGDKLTRTELEMEYNMLKRNRETEAETFEAYLINITDKNGTCVWL